MTSDDKNSNDVGRGHPNANDAAGSTASAVSTDPASVTGSGAAADESARVPDEVVDLDRIAADLDGVAAALARLEDGSYFTDEVTGEPLDDAVLAADPVARRNPTGT